MLMLAARFYSGLLPQHERLTGRSPNAKATGTIRGTDSGTQRPFGRLDKNSPINSIRYRRTGGEEGIGTLEALLEPTPLAGERLRPLGHLSVSRFLSVSSYLAIHYLAGSYSYLQNVAGTSWGKWFMFGSPIHRKRHLWIPLGHVRMAMQSQSATSEFVGSQAIPDIHCALEHV